MRGRGNMTPNKNLWIVLLALLLLVSVGAADTPTWTPTVSPNVTALPQTDYNGTYYSPLVESLWDLSNMTPIGVGVYGDIFGVNGDAIVVGSWFITLLVLYWLRQEDVMVPMFMAAILGITLVFAPGMFPNEWKWIILTLLGIIPIMAIGYALYKGPKQ